MSTLLADLKPAPSPSWPILASSMMQAAWYNVLQRTLHAQPYRIVHEFSCASNQALKDKSWGELSQAQRRIVDEQLRDFKHGGVALEV
jgi:Zn-dependent oligopeptidase